MFIIVIVLLLNTSLVFEVTSKIPKGLQTHLKINERKIEYNLLFK